MPRPEPAWRGLTTRLLPWGTRRGMNTSGTGSSNTGALYSFGVAGTNPVADRALGSVASRDHHHRLSGGQADEQYRTTITSLDISYTGEQWRNGGNITAHSLAFQYQIAGAAVITDANAPTTGWTTFPHARLYSALLPPPPPPRSTATLPANRTAYVSKPHGTVTAGQEIWLRWKDLDDSGNDHGLAIDDFSVTANGSPPGDNAPTVTGTTPAHAASKCRPRRDPRHQLWRERELPPPCVRASMSYRRRAAVLREARRQLATFTLTPAAEFSGQHDCTVTVTAGQVTDVDANDPPDRWRRTSRSRSRRPIRRPGRANVIINEVRCGYARHGHRGVRRTL